MTNIMRWYDISFLINDVKWLYTGLLFNYLQEIEAKADR
jgi:hypothetical protein